MSEFTVMYRNGVVAEHYDHDRGDVCGWYCQAHNLATGQPVRGAVAPGLVSRVED